MVDPVGGKGSGETQWGLGNKASIPPGIPLPADDPWVKALALLLKRPIAEVQPYAKQFRDNMFAALNHQISEDLKRAKKAAQEFKRSIQGNN
ncbi:MAG: hypothetical protein ABSA17_04315 [Rhabdochlamydiaceae bacterium]|jgi:hypothetical protein